jgi:hypothetical protein
VTTLLRKFVPLSILRKVAVQVNMLKTNTVDRIIFNNTVLSDADFYLLNQTKALPELKNIIEDISDNRIKTGFRKFLHLREKKFILHYKKTCIIEPKQGWGIIGNRNLIEYSLANVSAKHLKRPSLKYLSSKQKKLICLEKAISLRDTSERAYFHFYNDVIAKIPFLLKNGFIIDNIPIIVAHSTYNKPFFQELLQRSPWLASLNWIIQDEQVIKCEEIIFCRPRTLSVDGYKWIVDQFNYHTSEEGSKRIFLTRDPKRLRYISNMEELIPVLNKFNFTIVDTDNLSIKEQAAIIQSATILTGIHGAGMTNLAFKTNGKLSVLEIFPPAGVVPYHYAILSKRYGFNYSALMGKDYNAIKGSFTVDPQKLKEELQRIIAD